MNGRWSQVQLAPAPESVARGRAARLVIGFKVIMTPGDSERAVRQIDTEMHAIMDAVYAAMGVDRSALYWGTSDDELEMMRQWRALSSDEKLRIRDAIDAAKAVAQQSPYWGFFQAVISPIFADWMKFTQNEKFYDLWTTREEYEKWLERVRKLRATVEDKGIDIESPAPSDLTQTFGGEALDAAKRGVGDLMSMAKVAIYGALALVGVVAIGSVVQSVRTGKDPAHQLAAIPREYRK